MWAFPGCYRWCPPHNVQQRWPVATYDQPSCGSSSGTTCPISCGRKWWGKWSLANGILDESLRPTEIERKMVRWSQFGSDLDFLHLSGTFGSSQEFWNWFKAYQCRICSSNVLSANQGDHFGTSPPGSIDSLPRLKSQQKNRRLLIG